MIQSNERKLSRGIDYLGELGAKLRDLAGYATLASELIQNADDSKSANWIQFDVKQSALVVDNDGEFSDCGQVEADICGWSKIDGKMCDFHRFRMVASGDKRKEEGTTGAFGIGFTSVYQITDAPELISHGRHWKLAEDAAENERITVCSGCQDCRASDVPGTRFILPWATNPDSPLRTKWLVSAITPANIETLKSEVSSSLASTLIFLNNLTRISFLVEGKLHQSFECVREPKDMPDEIIVADQDGNNQIWKILHGEFNQAALALREKHGNKIEAKRRASVSVAVSTDGKTQGLFFATLPTQELTRFPFHINADFFPSNDRKRLISGADYQAEWNKLAISSAARALIAGFDSLKSFLSPEALWTIIETMKVASTEAGKGTIDSSYGEFWALFIDRVQEREVVYTSDRKWKLPPEAFLLERSEQAALIPVFDKLGIVVVHESLRPFFTILRECGVALFDLPPLIKAFTDFGLDKVVDRKSLPAIMSKNLNFLWGEIGALLARKRKKEDHVLLESSLKTIALAPTVSGSLAPIRQTYRASSETINLFDCVRQNTEFLDDQETGFEPLTDRCSLLDVTAAIWLLEQVGNDTLVKLHAKGSISVTRVIEWFEARQAELQESEDLKSRLASVSIFPCSNGVMPLNELVIPGSFDDPIGLTHIVDVKQLGGKRDFLRLLAPQRELTFEKYVLEYLPEAFENPDTTDQQKEAAVVLLATHLGGIKDNSDAKLVLSDVPLARTDAGHYSTPSEVYLRTKDSVEVLGDSVDFASLSEPYVEAVRELLRWLGSHTRPQYSHIIRRIKKIVSSPRSADADVQIERIFRHIVERLRTENTSPDLSALKPLKWLPEKNDHTLWYAPGEVYAIFQESIFSTQAKFLAFPAPLQRDASSLMDIIDIRKTPEPRLVVAHLLHCSRNKIPVKADLYLYLDQNYENAAIMQLRDKPCLFLQDKDKYARPTEVFWGQHPFRRFRYQLGSELRRYSNLFGVLKIKETPDALDALAVLIDISNEFGTVNLQLDEEAFAVVMECWRLLSTGLEIGQIDESDLTLLKDKKVIPDPRKLLVVPENIFFEERAGLASRFEGFLTYNVIPRPQGGWRAMRAVGVRSLEEVIDASLVECEGIERADDIRNLLTNRRILIERIVASQALLEDERPDTKILDSLEIDSVRSLRVVYALNAFRQTKHSQPERIDAFYRREENTLFFTRNDNLRPWASIAKELALAISPSSEPGRLSPGIFHILASETFESASRILDQLGYPTLQASPPTVLSTEIVGVIGAEGGNTLEGGTGIPTTGAVDLQPGMTPAEAVKGMMGPNVLPPTPMPPGSGQDETLPGTDGGGTKKTPRTGRLLSYVATGGDTDGGNQGKDRGDDILANKGVERVVQYERARGRIPEIMPPLNEGYDVVSKDEQGNIIRYIEVKAVSGEWGLLGVGVSKPQFDFSREKEIRSWLYVVERVADNDFRIYPINDPARIVTNYMFDKGWKAIAIYEPETEIKNAD